MRFGDADFEGEDPEDRRNEAMRQHLSPSTVDNSIRSALQMCWMTLPRKKKTPDELEAQFRRLVDRALRDMRDDYDAFGY